MKLKNLRCTHDMFYSWEAKCPLILIYIHKLINEIKKISHAFAHVTRACLLKSNFNYVPGVKSKRKERKAGILIESNGLKDK